MSPGGEPGGALGRMRARRRGTPLFENRRRSSTFPPVAQEFLRKIASRDASFDKHIKG
jgi:hypothetical protein